MKTQMQTNVRFFSHTMYPWIVCGIGMLFYCFNYFLRASPGTMQTNLMQEFHITAYQFGIFTACYYWAYTPMQIPVGMIYDRFGPRLVQFFACLTATLGLGIFLLADHVFGAYVGRFLIGLGAAFAYIGVLKLASVWLPPNRFATAAGLTTAFGKASAIISLLYLPSILQKVSSKEALSTAFILGVILSFCILIFMRNKPKESIQPVILKKITVRDQFKWLGCVLLNKQMWLIGIIGCFFYLPAAILLDAWGIPYLQTVYQLSAVNAAFIIIMTYAGWMIGSPTIGWLSDRIKMRRLPLLICGVLAMLMAFIIFYIPGLTLIDLYILFLFLGVFCGAHPLCFALAKENSPRHLAGTAVAVTNFLIMLSGVLFHSVVGKMIDQHAGTIILNNGIPVYSASDYTYALSIVPIGLAVSFVLTFFLKETYCETLEFAEPVIEMAPAKNELALES